MNWNDTTFSGTFVSSTVKTSWVTTDLFQVQDRHFCLRVALKVGGLVVSVFRQQRPSNIGPITVIEQIQAFVTGSQIECRHPQAGPTFRAVRVPVSETWNTCSQVRMEPMSSCVLKVGVLAQIVAPRLVQRFSCLRITKVVRFPVHQSGTTKARLLERSVKIDNGNEATTRLSVALLRNISKPLVPPRFVLESCSRQVACLVFFVRMAGSMLTPQLR